jgi:hypothetical protein
MNALLLAVVLSAAPPFELQPLDGPSVVGSLVELTPDRATVDTAGRRVTLETEKLAAIASQKKPKKFASADAGIVVELVDGSTIVAKQFTTEAAQATITLSEGDTLTAPTKIVRSVRLQRNSGPLADEWTRLLGQKADSDLLVVRKDQNIDYHKGVLHDVSKDAVQFDLDGEMLPVKRSKVFGFAYRHGAEAELPSAVCRISDFAGSLWSVRTLALSEKLRWTTPAGLDAIQPLDAIAQIDFSGGKIVYLSDLKPEIVRWTPFFDAGKSPPAVEQFFAPRYDRGFDSATLVLGGKEYRKGLALHSRTELMYRLPDRFGRFRAMAGVDDAVRPGGKVRLVIRGDGKDLLDTPISGNDAPRPVDVDLTGVRRLTIVVDYGEGLSAGDYLLLCNARLTK